MWLVTTQGFYSAVAYRGRKRQLLIRARVRDDLVNLDRQLPGVSARITEEYPSDYAYRLRVSRKEWKRILAQLTDEVDYDNFKDAVKEKHGKDRANAYMGVWSVLHRLQEPRWPRYRESRTTTGLGASKVTVTERMFDYDPYEPSEDDLAWWEAGEPDERGLDFTADERIPRPLDGQDALDYIEEALTHSRSVRRSNRKKRGS
jgi:hypothetical protein